MSTGHGAIRTTFSATLPMSRCDHPPRPCVPMTIRSMLCLRRIGHDAVRWPGERQQDGLGAELTTIVLSNRRVELPASCRFQFFQQIAVIGRRRIGQHALQDDVVDDVDDVEGRVERSGHGAAVLERGGRRFAEVRGDEDVLEGNHGWPHLRNGPVRDRPLEV